MTNAQRNFTLQQIAAAVGGRISGGEVRAHAPGHSAGSSPELSIRADPSAPGGVLVHCFSGEDPVAMKDWVLERLGAPYTPPQPAQPHLRLVANHRNKQAKTYYDGHLTRDGFKLAATYDYADADGVLAFQVLRYEHPTKPKTFMQRHPASAGGWLSGRGEPLLYRTPALAANTTAPVFFCEGEKDADRLAAMGLGATTVPNDAWPDNVSVLTGRDVIVLPDNDEAGAKRAAKAVEKLRGVAGKVRILNLPGLGHKGDVTDWLDAGGDVPRLMALADAVQPEPGNDNGGVIQATAFTLRPPSELPQREWLYGRHYVRKYVSVTVSPGGLDKTSLTTVEALAMATGRDLLGEQVHERVGVWLFNGEDPRDELERRIGAACLHYGITNGDIAGRMFVDSGREQALTIATQTREGVKIVAPVVDAMIENIRRNNIGVVIVDPFVSSHAVSENDNVAIDAVVKQGWAKIADACNCAVELVHHARKTGGDAVTIEHSRGAIALVAGARSGRALNPMTQEEAAKAGVDNRRLFFRVTDEKANMAPPADQSTRRQMVGVSLGNGRFGGDSVGVATAWRWPDAMDGVRVDDLLSVQRAIDGGEWRESSQSASWAGVAVAEALGLDLADTSARAKVAGMLKKWLSTGALKVERRPDEKRMMRPFIVVGERADD